MSSAENAPDPIRIALCITELHSGGAERCLAELAARLDRARFRPVVYCLAPLPARGEPSVVERIERAGVEIHSLHLRSKWQAWSAVGKLAGLLRRQQPQIVQTFLFHANIVGRLAARRARVPHILSGIRVAERRHRWYLWLDRVTSGAVERHVCVSQAVAEFSRTRGGLPADKLVVIPNGVDVARYTGVRPAELSECGLAAGQKSIVCVGRLDEQKRIDWLLQLSPGWMKALPDHDLLIVGDGPQRAQLARQAEALGIGGRVHFAGWRGDVPAILAASQLLVLPSAWEGMPNVVLEAMASRLPVVATEVEGVAEVLGPEAPGQLVPKDDPAEFSQRIIAIAGNPETARKLADANLARVESEFSLERMVSRYEAFFESVAGM